MDHTVWWPSELIKNWSGLKKVIVLIYFWDCDLKVSIASIPYNYKVLILPVIQSGRGLAFWMDTNKVFIYGLNRIEFTFLGKVLTIRDRCIRSILVLKKSKSSRFPLIARLACRIVMNDLKFSNNVVFEYFCVNSNQVRLWGSRIWSRGLTGRNPFCNLARIWLVKGIAQSAPVTRRPSG